MPTVYRIYVETCWLRHTKIVRNQRYAYLGIQDKVGDAMLLLHKVRNDLLSILIGCEVFYEVRDCYEAYLP